MGIKIKRDDKAKGEKLKPITIKYIFAIPLVGIMYAVVMLGYFLDVSEIGIAWAEALFLITILIAVGFTYWGFAWNVVSASRRLMVNPVFGRKKEITYENIKKIVVYKKKKRENMSHFAIIDKNDAIVVRIYPIMKNSGELFNRLKQMSIPMEEVQK